MKITGQASRNQDNYPEREDFDGHAAYAEAVEAWESARES